MKVECLGEDMFGRAAGLRITPVGHLLLRVALQSSHADYLHFWEDCQDRLKSQGTDETPLLQNVCFNSFITAVKGVSYIFLLAMITDVTEDMSCFYLSIKPLGNMAILHKPFPHFHHHPSIKREKAIYHLERLYLLERVSLNNYSPRLWQFYQLENFPKSWNISTGINWPVFSEV